MQKLVAVSHTVCAHAGDPKNLGTLEPWALPLGVGTWLTPGNKPPYLCVALLNLVAPGQIVRAYIQRSASKMGASLTSCFSRSLKDIGTDRVRSATYDFLSVIRSIFGPISYRFRDKRRKLEFFLPLCSPTAESRLRGFGSGAQKTRMMPLRDCQKV